MKRKKISVEERNYFCFVALPKCIATDRPSLPELRIAQEKGNMIFVITSQNPPTTPKQVDNFIDGFLFGCEVPRSEYITVFFNDTNLIQVDAQVRVVEKFRNFKFPDKIKVYTTLAKGRKANLLSEFLKIEAKKEPEEIGKIEKLEISDIPTQEKEDGTGV